MRGLKALAGAVAIALPTVFMGGAVQAQETAASKYSPPQVAWAGDVHVKKGGTATVLAKYRCWGGDEGTHLWVALKQGGGITGQTAEELAAQEGTSAIARAYYDTNVVDPSLVTITCNGHWQVHRYTVAREKGTLHKGSAFLQFCLFDSHADPTGEDLSYGFAYKYKLVDVHRAAIH